MIILRLILITSVFFFTNGDKIQCYFQRDEKLGYGCVVPELRTENITGVHPKHRDGKTNAEVEYVKLSSSDFRSIPRGIHDFFPNVRALTFKFDKLEKITRNDLENFGEKLTYLSIEKSSIEVIPEDIFASTPNIKKLFLSTSHLKTIDGHPFEDLKDLVELSINFPGITSNATDQGGIQKLISTIGRRYHQKSKETTTEPQTTIGNKETQRTTREVQKSDYNTNAKVIVSISAFIVMCIMFIFSLSRF